MHAAQRDERAAAGAGAAAAGRVPVDRHAEVRISVRIIAVQSPLYSNIVRALQRLKVLDSIHNHKDPLFHVAAAHVAALPQLQDHLLALECLAAARTGAHVAASGPGPSKL